MIRPLKLERVPGLQSRRNGASTNGVARKRPPHTNGAHKDARQELWDEFLRTRWEEYRNQLAEIYLPIVRSVAEQVTSRLPRSVDPDDLISAGVFGLLQSLENFDPNRGTKFETYCRMRIRGAMIDELRSQDLLSRDARGRANRVAGALQKLRQELGREPNSLEVADEVGLSQRELEAVQQKSAVQIMVSLDSTPRSQDGGGTGKRSGRAMIRIAVDMATSGMIEPREAVGRIDAEKLREVLHPTLDPKRRPDVLAKGLPASPGAAIGKVVFTATDAEVVAARGDTVILVRNETSPEDIRGMQAAAGILTARGGMTSHAAVVARGMGISCVTGCSAVKIERNGKAFAVGATTVNEGDTITLDGSTGEVFVGTATLVPAEMTEEFGTLMGWVDEVRRLRVRTNADTATDALTARAFGAEGIGLCRTEHMFFAPERLASVREMIVAEDEAGRRAALEKILPVQEQDFFDIFAAMDGLPVTIRLLDPPLHEFLPHDSAGIAALAEELGRPKKKLANRLDELIESNPMLGHRGCRVAITYPEVYEVQVRALFRAAVRAVSAGHVVLPEIMIPFVSIAAELEILRRLVDEVAAEELASAEIELPYAVGTMIELPRACLLGDQIAEHADFFSFGTNDLTQTTFGLSRDDAGKFLGEYVDRGLLAGDPFVALDKNGVGSLIRMAVERGRTVKTKLKVGICGEHGGEPSSVEFCHIEGFDYVSCSPFRVPIARVAAARAALAGEARSK